MTDQRSDLTALDWLTPSQAARVLGLSAQRVRILGAEGHLASVRTPLGSLYRRDDVERLAREREARRPPGPQLTDVR